MLSDQDPLSDSSTQLRTLVETKSDSGEKRKLPDLDTPDIVAHFKRVRIFSKRMPALRTELVSESMQSLKARTIICPEGSNTEDAEDGNGSEYMDILPVKV